MCKICPIALIIILSTIGQASVPPNVSLTSTYFNLSTHFKINFYA